jgi:hypothetical protein
MNRTGYFALAIGLAFIGLSAPSFASAASISVQTATIIPVSGASCAPLAVQSVTPYIFDSELHSFDVTIADPQYVSILATVGDTGIPFNQMTRTMSADGLLRIHVDIQATPIYGSLPITLTLISAQTGQPVCVSTVAFSVLGDAAAPASRPTTSTTSGTSSTPTVVATSTTEVPVAVVAGSVTGIPLAERMQRICTGNGSLELWFLLITLYLVGTAVVALSDPSLTKRSMALPGALIGIPFVLLAAFWYFTPICRGAWWVPAILLLIAGAGAILAYRDRRPVATLLQLPSTIRLPAAEKPAPSKHTPMIVEKFAKATSGALKPSKPGAAVTKS